jgi:hypothetical protein
MRRLKMRTSYNRSNVNIEEKETEYKHDHLIMVNRCHKKMQCLKCGKKFFSEGLHNRICEKCNLINEGTGATTYSLSLKFAEITDHLKENKFEFY